MKAMKQILGVKVLTVTLRVRIALKTKICLRKIWEAVGVIIRAYGMYVLYYPVSSPQTVMCNDSLIIFLTINTTVREARLISKTLDKKRDRKRRKNERNANITVREVTTSKKESTDGLFFSPFQELCFFPSFTQTKVPSLPNII